MSEMQENGRQEAWEVRLVPKAAAPKPVEEQKLPGYHA